MEIKKQSHVITSLTGWLARSFTALSQILIMPLLLAKLGISGYATYALIILAGSWLSLCDFGLANALQNITSKALHKSDSEQQQQICLMALILIFIFSVVLMIFLHLVACNFFERLRSYFSENGLIFDLNTLTWSSVIFIGIGLGNIGIKLLFAEQKGWVAYLVGAVSQSFGLVLTYSFISSIPDSERIQYSIIFNYGPIAIITFLLTIYLLVKKSGIVLNGIKDRLIQLIKLAANFFIFSLVAQMILGLDLIILSNLRDVENIAQYSIVQKIFLIPIVFYQVILSAWWPNITRSWSENKMNNQKKIASINIFIGIFIASITWIIFKYNILSIKEKIIGDGVQISNSLWTLFFLYVLVRIWTDTFTTILLATNKINVVTMTAIVQAVISAPLQFYLGVHYGAHGLIIGIITSFIFTVSWIFPRYCSSMNSKY